jgi:hypothetical protein
MRTGKLILVWVAALMMVADPASACRWRARSSCAPVYCEPSSCGSVYYESGCGSESACGTVYTESSCGTTVPADCSGCEVSEGVTTNRPAESAPVEPATPQPTFEPSPAPAAPTEPSPEPFAVPAEPAPATPAPVTPAPTPAPPLPSTPAPVEPAPAAAMPTDPAPAPKSDVEDLFSEPATTTPMPETKPAEPAEVEDLFKDPAPAPATPPADKPAEVDDLFKDLDDTKDGNKAAASDAPAEVPAQPENKELEDLFSDPQPAPMSAVEKPAPAQVTEGTPASDMRTWTDNTGNFQIRGRLVVVGKTHVRILKETGKFTTVPFGRLSQADLAFVQQQADRAIVANN